MAQRNRASLCVHEHFERSVAVSVDQAGKMFHPRKNQRKNKGPPFGQVESRVGMESCPTGLLAMG
jgi:hypothetical protein